MKALDILNDLRIKYNAHYSKECSEVIKLGEAIDELVDKGIEKMLKEFSEPEEGK